MARRDLGLPAPAGEPVDFTGVMMPYEQMLELYSLLRHYGVMPEAGGWYDQEARYRSAMLLCMGLYADAVVEVKAELENKGNYNDGDE